MIDKEQNQVTSSHRLHYTLVTEKNGIVRLSGESDRQRSDYWDSTAFGNHYRKYISCCIPKYRFKINLMYVKYSYGKLK